MSTEKNVPHIKSGAKVPVIFTNTEIHALYTIYEHLINGLTTEDSLALKDRIENKKPLSGRDISVINITKILNMVHKAAEENNLVEFKPLTDTVLAVVS